MGIDPLPWETDTLRQMSVAFVAQRQASEKLDCVAPYNGDLTPLQAKRARIAKTLEAAFRHLAEQQQAAAKPAPSVPSTRRSRRQTQE